MVAAANAEIERDEAVADMDSARNSGDEGVAATLEACPNSRFISALPVLLRALPPDAQDRCLIVLREALHEELEGGCLENDKVALETWRVALGSSAIGEELMQKTDAKPLEVSVAAPTSVELETNHTKAPEKRPFRAMAVPFSLAVPVTKRPNDTVLDSEDKPVSETNKPVRSLYVANVPYDATEHDIKTWFQNQLSGVGNVEKVRLLIGSDGKPKGAAILSLNTPEAAATILALDGQLGLEERRLIVKEDQHATKGDKGDGRGRLKRCAKGIGKGEKNESAKGESKSAKGEAKSAKGKADPEKDDRSVLVKNLAFNATEANIGELFAGLGELAAVRIARDSRSGKSKGFAVVEFVNKTAVLEAVKRNGQSVRGRDVKIEAMGTTSDPLVSANGSCEHENVAVKENANVENDPVVKESVSAEMSANEVRNMSASSCGEPESEVDALRKHAQKMVAQSSQVVEPPKKRSRGEKPLQSCESGDVFPEGEEGLKAVAELLSAHSSAEALLAAAGAEALKGRLAALGLKSGGSPLERAQRLLRLKGVSRLDKLPNDLLNKASKNAERGRIINVSREPIKFVKAGVAEEETNQESVDEQQSVAAEIDSKPVVTRRGIEMCD